MGRQKSAPLFYRWMALLLSFSLILGDNVSKPGYSAPSRREMIPSSENIFKLESLEEDSALRPYSNVGEIAQAEQTDGPSVIHIRDLHCNYEAQLNISKTIEVISKENPGQKILVMTEGAEGVVDTDLFGTFPDQTVRMEASKAMMREGKITGPEYLSITQHGNVPIEIQGVEKENLYIENFNAYRDVIGESQETGEFLQSADEVLDQIKKKTFSDDLYEFEQKRKDYEKGTVAFDQYTAYLGKAVEKAVNLQDYPNFTLLMTLVAKQKELSVEKVEEERAGVMSALNDKITKEELSDLIKASLEFRLGKKSAGEYFGKLESLIQEKLVPADYAELGKYIELVKLQENIQHQILMDEVKSLGQKLEASLVKTDQDRKLLDFIRRFDILRRMFSLEMTREDLKYLHENKESCRVEILLKELDEYLMHMSLQVAKHLTDEKKVRYVAKVFDNSEKFYGYALERDQALFDNALEKMEESGVKVAVLVTGGFHSEGVTQRLKDHKMNYAVLTPRVSGQPDMSTYQELMLDDRISVQTISFVSLFNKVADRLSETLEVEELGKFADTLFRLMKGQGTGNPSLERWVNDWVSSKGGYEKISKTQQILVDKIREKIGIEAPVETGVSFQFSDQEIETLVEKSSLLTAELTVEVLKEMKHPALSRAEAVLEERRKAEERPAGLQGNESSASAAQMALPSAADLEPLERNTEFTWKMRDRRTGKTWFLKLTNAADEALGYQIAKQAGVNISAWTKVSMTDIPVSDELKDQWIKSLTRNDGSISVTGFLSQDIHEMGADQLAEKDTAGMESILAFLAFTGGQDFALRHNIEPLEIGGAKRYLAYDLTTAAGHRNAEDQFGYDNRMIFDGWGTLKPEKLLEAVERLEKLSPEEIRKMAVDSGLSPAEADQRTANLLGRQKILRQLIAQNLREALAYWDTGLSFLPLSAKLVQMYRYTNSLNTYNTDLQGFHYVEEIWSRVLKDMIGSENIDLYNQLLDMSKDEIRNYALAHNPFLIANLLAIQEAFQSLSETLERFLTPGTLYVVDEKFKADFEMSRDKGREMLENLNRQIENLRELPFKEGQIYKVINGAADQLAKKESAEEAAGGLIGKYQVLTKPEFDETAGMVRFKGRHVETGVEEEIQIPAKKMDRANLMSRFFSSPVDNEILNAILDWFEAGFSGNVLSLGENPYGIQGLGNQDIVAVSEILKDERIAFFHEMAEAMAAAGRLTAETVLKSLKDRTWYDAHMAKPGRQDMGLHYAIRALQREVFAQEDVDLTYRIKDRLTLSSARGIVLKKLTKLGKGPARPGGAQLLVRITNEFRRDSINLATREQEEKLLDDLIAANIEREEKEVQARRREDEERRARAAAEETEINRIAREKNEIHLRLMDLEKTFPRFVMSAEDLASIKDSASQVMTGLKGKDEAWVAEAIFQLLEASYSLKGVLSPFESFLTKEGLRILGPKVTNLVLMQLYRGAMDERADIKISEKLVNFFNAIESTLPYFNQAHLATLADAMVEDIERSIRSRPFVRRYEVSHIAEYEKYFDSDPSNPDVVFFKKDFEFRVVWLRNLKDRRALDRLYSKAQIRKNTIFNLTSRIFKKLGSDMFTEQLLKKLESGKSSPETRHILFNVLSKKENLTPGQTGRIVAQGTALYTDADDFKKEEIMASLVQLSEHTDDLSVQEKISTFLQNTMDAVLEGISKAGNDLKAADERYDSLMADKAAASEADIKAAKDNIRNAREKQYQLMEEFENRIKILAGIAKKAYEKNNSDYSMRLLSYLNQVARNDKWDPSVRAEILSNVSGFIGYRFASESIFFFESILEHLEPPAIAREIMEKAVAQDTPKHPVSFEALAELLRRKDIQPRTKYLLMQRHQNNEAFLKMLVFDRGEKGETLGLSTDIRLYALSWYTKYLSHTVGDKTVYHEKEFEAVMASLGKAAVDFVESVKDDNDRIRGIFEKPWHQSEEAKVYLMATHVAMQHHMPLSTPDGFLMTSSLIAQTKVMPYWENASSTFRIGGRIFRNVSNIANDFFHMAAHELMHDVLKFSYGYSSFGLKNLIVHEFLADVNSFIFSEIFGMDTGIISEGLEYHQHFDDVTKDELHTVEGHEGARAQLEVIRKSFASLGIPLNLANWKLILEAAVDLIQDSSKRNLSSKAFIENILRRVVSSRESSSEPAEPSMAALLDNVNIKAFLGLEITESDEHYRTPILGVPEVLTILAELRRRDVNIADVGLNAPEHREVNEAIARAFTEGRIERREDVSGKRVFVVKGVSALAGRQRAHAGIEFNAVYIAEGAFNETMVRHEVEELGRWQEKALQLAGLDPKTDWNRLSGDTKKALKEDLRNWMSLNPEEAESLEARFHEEANRVAPVELDDEDSLASPRPLSGQNSGPSGQMEKVTLGGSYDGKRLGGQLPKTPFTGDVWIRAGMFSYRIGVRDGRTLLQAFDETGKMAQGPPLLMTGLFKMGRFEKGITFNDMNAYDVLLSQNHFSVKVTRENGQYFIEAEDLFSKNGTIVEFAKPRPSRNNGDEEPVITLSEKPVEMMEPLEILPQDMVNQNLLLNLRGVDVWIRYGNGQYTVYADSPDGRMIGRALEEGVTTLGREADISIRASEEVSRKHVELEVRNGKLIIRSIGDTGTFYRGAAKQMDRKESLKEIVENILIKLLDKSKSRNILQLVVNVATELSKIGITQLNAEELQEIVSAILPKMMESRAAELEVLSKKEKERLTESLAETFKSTPEKVRGLLDMLEKSQLSQTKPEPGNFFTRVLEAWVDRASKSLREITDQIKERIREAVYRNHARQILKSALNENLSGQMKGFVRNNPKFVKAMRTADPVEILTRFAAYTFTGRNAKSFEMEKDGITIADELEQILERVEFARVPLKIKKLDIEKIENEAPGLLNAENPQESLRALLMEYRSLKARGIENENLPEKMKSVAARLEALLVRRDDMGMPLTLASLLLGENGTSKKNNSEQKGMIHALEMQIFAGHAVGEGMRDAARNLSGVMKNWEALRRAGVFGKAGDGHDSNIFVIDLDSLAAEPKIKDGKISFEGVGTGINEALKNLFGVRPDTKIKLMSPYSVEKTREILKQLGVDQGQISKIEMVENWIQAGTLEAVLKGALNVTALNADAREKARKDVVVILSQKAQEELMKNDLGSFAKEMKIVVGHLGKEKGAGMIADVLGMALLLGSVEEAFQNGSLSPELKPRLRNLFRAVLAELLKDEQEPEKKIDEMINKMEGEGYFRIPPVTDVMNDMMRDILIDETYIEISA